MARGIWKNLPVKTVVPNSYRSHHSNITSNSIPLMVQDKNIQMRHTLHKHISMWTSVLLSSSRPGQDGHLARRQFHNRSSMSLGLPGMD